MRRHEFIALPSRAAVEWPLAARAQPATRLRLGLYSRLSVGSGDFALRLLRRASWVGDRALARVKLD
ncbi:MAG: hypothetical protein WCF47_20565 [Pseudolabrys sp.]